MKKQYYDISNLLATDAQYMMLLGERANGKSYQVKKTVIERAYKAWREKRRDAFVYLRRWREDIKTANIDSYFADMPVDALTKGEFNIVTCMHGYIYFGNVSDEGKVERKVQIGRYCALNEAERYKSNVFLDCNQIIYEEFITNQLYLSDEPNRLQQFVSTVFRDRKGTVYLIGNTLSRVCPYFSEWALDNVLRQKQGEIDLYNFTTLDGGLITIAVEYCQNANTKNKMFFGQAEKNIIGGVWETKEVPHLPHEYKHYEKLYEIKVLYKKFSFILELLFETEEGGLICYVYPSTTQRYVERVLSDSASDNPFVTYGLNLKNRCEQIINDCFRQAKVFYSDNLTGADFKNVNLNYKIGQLRIE